LKEYKLAPSPPTSPGPARSLRSHLSSAAATGYVMLDRPAQTAVSPQGCVAARPSTGPEIPLNTNASENDIRAFVTKRKISGGTVSNKGRGRP